MKIPTSQPSRRAIEAFYENNDIRDPSIFKPVKSVPKGSEAAKAVSDFVRAMDGEFEPQIYQATVAGKPTLWIDDGTDGGDYLFVANMAGKLLASGSQSESESISWDSKPAIPNWD